MVKAPNFDKGKDTNKSFVLATDALRKCHAEIDEANTTIQGFNNE